MLTVGGTVSTANVRLADAELPAASIALTVKVCAPSTSGALVYWLGAGAHGAKLPLSILPSLPTAPESVNWKLGVMLLVGPVGPEIMLTVGGTVSTINMRLADAVLPAASIALTVKV